MVISKNIFFIFATLLACGANAYEFNLAAGLQSYSVQQLEEDNSLPDEAESGTGLHLGASVKNNYGDSNKHWFGFGVDIDRIMGQKMLALRALDYEYELNEDMRIGAFFGAATLDTGLPQNGYYTGVNASYLNIIDKLDLVVEARYGSGLARDRKLLASDPSGERTDMFLDFTSIALSLRWNFTR
ncbi:hypothetical protein QFX18_01955 [Saccharophagus degradans]|uniref:hypothetical protein n=1 Tax=Saccharophagus degradans TaxID=86304 RepID=UPI0024781EC0|nr:hypothetical protein [Saccharophagus degradans]WGO98823.1 hypothetical protein QFX18_01955 [Saccharophagus degradans]